MSARNGALLNWKATKVRAALQGNMLHGGGGFSDNNSDAEKSLVDASSKER